MISIEGKILIVTENDDLHASEVIRSLNSLGLQDTVIRLSIETFKDNVKATFDGRSYKIAILDSGRCFDSDEICVVWYRKPRNVLLNQMDPGIADFIAREFKTFINGLYYCTKDHAFWINGREQSLAACNKMYQLRIANEVGFNVPWTIITNDPSSINVEDVELCNKCISIPDYSIDGVPYLYRTRICTLDEIERHIDSISECPTLFQCFIRKTLDIRVTIMGRKKFACEIHSQDAVGSEIDFRLIKPEKIVHKPHDLPPEIDAKIEIFMDRMGLQFSAMDLVLDEDGKYWFLENNCNGQWLWIEYLTGMPLIQAMVDLLLDKTCRR